MKELFSRFYKMSIFTSIIFMIFGLILFFKPSGVFTTISFVIGIFICLVGIYHLLMYFKERIHFKNNLSIGVFSFVAGVLLIVNTKIIATIIPILIGICMVALSIKKFDLSLRFKDNHVIGWSYMLVMSIITFVCGLVLILNPISGAFIATKIVGLIIIIYSITDIIDCIIFRNSLKKIKKVIRY